MSTAISSRQALAYRQATGYNVHEVSGLVRVYVGRGARRNDLVGLYNAEVASMDPEAGKWATLCERHSTIVNHESRALANSHLTAPEGWCEACEAYYAPGAQTAAVLAEVAAAREEAAIAIAEATPNAARVAVLSDDRSVAASLYAEAKGEGPDEVEDFVSYALTTASYQTIPTAFASWLSMRAGRQFGIRCSASAEQAERLGYALRALGINTKPTFSLAEGVVLRLNETDVETLARHLETHSLAMLDALVAEAGR